VVSDGTPGIATLAEWAHQTRLDEIPTEVLAVARLVILDTIGVALGGSEAPQVQRLADTVGAVSGPATMIGSTRRGSAHAAALVNGTANTWLDFDSGHIPPPGEPLLPAGHMPVHVVPAALAVGEALGSTGADVLTAIVVGYDVAARVGISSRLRAPIHPHGTYPAMGAAAAAARLHGLDGARTLQAMAIAMGLTLVPSFENGYQGAFVRNVYAGYGAHVGVLAVHLARAGLTAESDPIATLYGGIVSPWHDPELLIDGLGSRWECTRGYIKPFPSVRYGHPAIEAARSLLAAGVGGSDIERVLVETYDLPATLVDRDPQTELAAKFSLPWAVASMLVRGSAGPDDFRAMDDDSVRFVSRVVEVVESPAMTARTPQDRPARITVWSGGNEYVAEVDRSAGGPDMPMRDADVIAKFSSMANRVLGPAQAAAVISDVLRIESVADVATVVRRLTRAADT
jgi:2-methylcitrate dehydratase PrpD